MNSVREGYKMTELGEIPSEWQVVSTEEILVKDKNSIKIGPFGSQLKKEFLTEKGYKVYGQENVFYNDFKLGNRYINEERYNQLKTSNLLAGDLVISMMGTVGKTAIIPQDIEEGIMDSHLIRLRVDENKYDKRLLAQMIRNSELIKKQIKKLSVGGIMEGLSSTIIKQLKFPLINIKEQEKIASILSTVDEQIDNVDALIEKNKELKKGLMQTLLTKGIGHTKFKKTEIGEIPEEWNIFKLSDCATIIDSLHETPEYSEYGFPMIRVVDVNGKAINTKLTNKVCETIYKKFTKKYEPKQGDIIMSRVGSYGLVSYLKDSERVCLGQNIVIITTELCKKYLFYVLSSEYVKNNIEKVTVGSSQKTLSLANINELKILIPSIKEQNKISLILSDIDEKIEKYENKKQKLEELKKGLMQQLLSGQIRVNID